MEDCNNPSTQFFKIKGCSKAFKAKIESFVKAASQIITFNSGLIRDYEREPSN
ncbi:UNVERIFIED_CONTAM: hypothetical protein Slati_1312900 [Sesamum latifolium]|uniref:Uncharacterized protein n=1 Tax=Sesamum latifolium TaxID=2727402 RepID=A0AAW2XHR2_9LAMI